jgi:hypothetical protein
VKIKNACFIASFLGIAGLMAQLASCSSGNVGADGGIATGGSGGTGTGGSGASGGSGGSTTGGSGGSGGSNSDAGTDSGYLQLPIVASATGYVAMGDVEGVLGAWYAYGDCWGSNGRPPGVCETVGDHPVSACSTITYPPESIADAGPEASGPGFPPTPAGSQEFCLKGSVAVVPMFANDSGTGYDYSNVFGIGLGINLNTKGTDIMPYNANTAAGTHAVVGFSFSITGAAAVTAEGASIRVAVPVVGQPTSDEYFNNGATAVATDTSYTFLWTDLTIGVTPGGYTMPATQTLTTFDPTKIQAIQFAVVNSTSIMDGSAPLPTNGVCISNLTLLAAK